MITPRLLAMALGMSVATQLGVVDAAAPQAESRSYDVTVTNLTSSQILSPPLLATHRTGIHLFEQGQLASEGVRLVAEGGNTEPLANQLQATATDVQRTTEPVPPGGSVTIRVTSLDGDQISAIAMLAVTNDGFTGLDAVGLGSGSASVRAEACDAGTEENTERAADVPGNYGGMGHPATDPVQPIAPHLGINGRADVESRFGWSGPVAEFSITSVPSALPRTDEASGAWPTAASGTALLTLAGVTARLVGRGQP